MLRGAALVPEQIEWEWLEYKQTFNELLQKYSAMLARDAKRLKRELAEGEEQQANFPPDLQAQKSELRRRLAIGAGQVLPLRRSSGSASEMPPPEAAP